MCFDLSNFYLGTPLDRAEYVRIHIHKIPLELYEECGVCDFLHNDWVYFKITKGVHDLPQTLSLSNNLLETSLAKHGHKWRPVMSTLIVGDFRVE